MPAPNIKNEETNRLVKELADRAAERMTTVEIEDIREKLKRQHPAQQHQGLADKLLHLGRETAPLWREPWRSTPHGELLYDEHGVPR